MADDTQPTFTPNPEAKGKAKQKRIIALVLWAVAITLELVAIFWLLRPSFDELVASQGFPQWRWYTLIGFIVVIGALAIIGSLLWKQANRLDPASKKDTVKFFIQNQLGAFIAGISGRQTAGWPRPCLVECGRQCGAPV